MNAYIFLKRVIVASGTGVVYLAFVWYIVFTIYLFFIFICDFVLVVFLSNI